MTVEEIERIAATLRRGESAPGVELLKLSRVRVVARADDVFLKVFSRPGAPRREARTLLEGERRGLPVPKLIGAGSDWIATRWIDACPVGRDDLPDVLRLVDRMHASGMLHRDLHAGNLLRTASGIVLTDLQRARFLPFVPGLLRRRELGWLAFSLGEPLPRELAAVRFWRDLRAWTHWRSRTRRCLKESGSFTRFETAWGSGFRRRDADGATLTRVLDPSGHGEPLKVHPRGELCRSGPYILKRFPSRRTARRAWVHARGLEVRGIETGCALAWAGRWLVMEDAGPTVTDFVEGPFATAPEPERLELADRLADLLADLHRRGIYHADLKANNIALRPGSPPRLLDYGRVRFGWRVSRRRRIKNLAQLNAALPDTVPGSLRERALQRYVSKSGWRGDAGRLRRRVVALSLRRRHRWHGC